VEERKLLEELSGIEPLLLRVSWLEQRLFAQEIAALNLTPPQFFVLRSIVAHGAHCTPHGTRGGVPTMSTLAGDTLQHCATVTGVVDRLEMMGLVTRQRDAEDRRQVLVELTPAAADLLSRIRGNRERRLRETLLRLPDEDVSELLRLLRVYLEVLRLQYEGTEDPPPAGVGRD